MKKKFIIFMLYLIGLTLILPCNINALEYNENYGNIYMLTDTTTEKTTTTISEEEAKKIVGTTSMCEEGSGLKNFFNTYWKIIAIVAPALVILMTSIDFFKAITSSDADRLKKSANSALKRALAFVLLLLLPYILNIVFGWFGLSLCL